ncbi:MAG TPA: rod shape-determining protein MreC [Candidatus Faecousia excrementigallinarum]|uniref:Cell shape-determining protein MreC n=1 Tax=Candidatus Faecousia excrementigallinarum TaxID=2840806 RepID=A0A9D0Z3M1_9FIRM|nr:rod shape-determining protein MreC [Candidatus Faecousia excrementigallinarum]
MRHFFTTKIKIVLLAAVLIAAVSALVLSLTGNSYPSTVVQGVLAPLRAGATHLTAQAEKLYDYIFSYESLLAENEALKEQLSQMENQARQAAALTKENQALRDALELKENNEGYEMVDGYIISWSSNDWSSTFTINQGTNAGIAEGMCAITANGEVVGLVSEVGSNYAVIKTVLDSSLEISATIVSSGYNGMVKGGYSTDHPDQMRMNYLPSSATIRNNDQVVTTGSTVYPRNLILGYVVDAGFDDTGVAKYAQLRPAADIGALDQVFIITKYNVE